MELRFLIPNSTTKCNTSIDPLINYNFPQPSFPYSPSDPVPPTKL